MILVPGDIKNRLVDMFERTQQPPNVWRLQHDIRLSVERDYRQLHADVKAIREWVTALERQHLDASVK